MGSFPGRTRPGLELADRLAFMRLTMFLARERGTNAGARELYEAHRRLRSPL